MVPLLVNGLGAEGYGELSVVLSAAAFFYYSDLGIGLVIVNVIAKNSNINEIREVTSTVWTLLVVVGILGCFFSAIFYVIDNSNPIAAGIFFVFLGIPSGLIQRVLFGDQKIVLLNGLITGGKLLSLAAVFFLAYTGSKSIGAYVSAILGIPSLLGLITSYLLFSAKYYSMRPTIKLHSNWLGYVKIGGVYMMLQMVPFFEMGFDVYILSVTGNKEIISNFDISQKLYMYIISIVSIGVFPLWPAIAASIRDGNILWVKKKIYQSYSAVFSIAFLLGVFLVSYGDYISMRWVGSKIILNKTDMICFSLATAIVCLAMVQSIVLNGLNVIREQAVVDLYYILIMVIGKFVIYYNYGVASALVWLSLACCVKIIVLQKIMAIKIEQAK
jgi:O-antigen/teichoic acid export membrane protein